MIFSKNRETVFRSPALMRKRTRDDSAEKDYRGFLKNTRVVPCDFFFLCLNVNT